MNIVLMGPQGSGKGSVAGRISKDFGLVHLSTGQLFREAIANGEKLGLQAQKYMNEGKLVPTKLTLQILKDRIKQPDCNNGVILDGYPRSIEQAKAIQGAIDVDVVINIDLPRDECIKRLLARRICPKCHANYSALLDKKKSCSKCGAKLVQRDDDNLDAIQTRLEVYGREKAPLIDFYGDKVLTISGIGSPEEVYRPVKDFLSNWRKK